VDLLRRLNPGFRFMASSAAKKDKRTIFGLAREPFLGLDSLYLSPRSGRSNWNQGDLLLADWYRDVGRRLEFDVAYVVDWDISSSTRSIGSTRTSPMRASA
jgi:hypothetical protein